MGRVAETVVIVSRTAVDTILVTTVWPGGVASVCTRVWIGSLGVGECTSGWAEAGGTGWCSSRVTPCAMAPEM